MIDTHAHVHFSDAFADVDEVLERAAAAGITGIINVGVNPEDSARAVEFARRESPLKLFATAGVHPHEAGRGQAGVGEIARLATEVVAIGECGLDYYRNRATKSDQDRVLRAQIELAHEHDLPLIFHVRDAWDDFFAVLKDYPQARGVIHSFTGYQHDVEAALTHDGELFFGLNGIMTFTKDEAQLSAAKAIPKDRVLLETDCPYLAPVPYRGKRNEPAFAEAIAEFVAILQGLDRADLVHATLTNTRRLFGVSA